MRISREILGALCVLGIPQPPPSVAPVAVTATLIIRFRDPAGRELATAIVGRAQGITVTTPLAATIERTWPHASVRSARSATWTSEDLRDADSAVVALSVEPASSGLRVLVRTGTNVNAIALGASSPPATVPSAPRSQPEWVGTAAGLMPDADTRTPSSRSERPPAAPVGAAPPPQREPSVIARLFEPIAPTATGPASVQRRELVDSGGKATAPSAVVARQWVAGSQDWGIEVTSVRPSVGLSVQQRRGQLGLGLRVDHAFGPAPARRDAATALVGASVSARAIAPALGVLEPYVAAELGVGWAAENVFPTIGLHLGARVLAHRSLSIDASIRALSLENGHARTPDLRIGARLPLVVVR